MTRRRIVLAEGVTDSGVPFSARIQYDPDYKEYRLTVFTANCTSEDVENRACYTDDIDDAKCTLGAMFAEFKEKYTA